jgi:3-hydroxyisobutyrate dehydrogenase-like beta-hydroxyacid dehydrogenase
MTVAVIGLGDLGLACALCLHEAGYEAIGVDLSEDRRATWQRATGRAAADGLSGLVVDRALICVRTTSQAHQVLGELRVRDGGARDDAAALAAPTSLTASASLAAYVVTTLDPAFARGLAAYGSDGFRVIELPVSGGRAAARAGELTVLIGGDQAAADDVEFVRRTLARRTFMFPRFGDATLAKLLNNTAAAYNAAAFATCLALAERAGLPADVCADVIRASSGASWVADNFEGLIGELLAKDASLLATEAGRLPAIEVSDPDQFLATLAQGIRLLARPTRRQD